MQHVKAANNILQRMLKVVNLIAPLLGEMKIESNIKKKNTH